MAAIPGVVEIALTRVRAHLLVDDELALVDTGLARSAARIEKAVQEQGRSLDELRRVILTHGHPDHAGSARDLADRGATILIHPADGDNLRTTWADVARRPSRSAVFAAMTPQPPDLQPIEDGDVLPVLGGLRVIHTPGHTPGSICLYGARDRVLFVGDSLQRRFGRLSFASTVYSDDPAQNRRSMARLLDLDIAAIVFSHYAPLTDHAGEALRRLVSPSGKSSVEG